MWSLTESPKCLTRQVGYLPLVPLLALLGVDAWVYLDAAHQQETGSIPTFRIGQLTIDTPASWFVGCLLLWVVVFPLYLIARTSN